jgi:putative ATP-dependent endonuclease of OLD family
MKVAKLVIRNFRGISEGTLYFPDSAVVVGDNNVGKSTVFEALDLALGPDRLNRHPQIDEHDFYVGKYVSAEGELRHEIRVEATITALSDGQKDHFRDSIEWWNTTDKMLQGEPIEGVDAPDVHAAIRVTFIGFYDPSDDDFIGQTYFSRTLEEGASEQIWDIANGMAKPGGKYYGAV